MVSSLLGDGIEYGVERIQDVGEAAAGAADGIANAVDGDGIEEIVEAAKQMGETAI